MKKIKTKPRSQKLEQWYRNSVKEKLYELCVIIAPTAQMEIGALNYSELLEFVAELLKAERIAVTLGEEFSDEAEPEQPDVALALD